MPVTASARAARSGGGRSRGKYRRRSWHHGGRAEPRQSPPREAAIGPVYGALDLGTNNCRLLLAVPAMSGFTVVDRGPQPTTYHFMRTYALVDGKWKLIANHTMAIPEE